MNFKNLILTAIFTISILFADNEIQNRINTYIKMLEIQPIEIAFNYEIRSENFEKSEPWKIIVDSTNKFRFQTGPKILVSDGNYWKMYDERTNQIILQDRDTVFENSILKWLERNHLNSLNFEQKNSSEYVIYLKDDVTLQIELQKDLLNINFEDGDFIHNLYNLTIRRYNGPENFYQIEIPDAFLMDMRSQP